METKPVLPSDVTKKVDELEPYCDAWLVYHPDFGICAVSNSFPAICGWTERQLLRQPIITMLKPSLHQVHQGHERFFYASKAKNRSMASKRTIEFQTFDKETRTCTIELSRPPESSQGHDYAIALLLNVEREPASRFLGAFNESLGKVDRKAAMALVAAAASLVPQIARPLSAFIQSYYGNQETQQIQIPDNSPESRTPEP